MSKFIVIEGPDRVGKATQTKLLKSYLLDRGFKVATFEVPLRSNFTYDLIYSMLNNGLAKKLPKLFQFLQYLNRQIFQWTELSSVEKDYDYIIMDRWSLSTIVYGSATGVPQGFTQNLYKKLKLPDYTIVLSGKSHEHKPEDDYESDNSLQNKVRELYSQWALQYPGRSSLIDCSASRQSILDNIVEDLLEAGIIQKEN